jgi:hypothetical protein
MEHAKKMILIPESTFLRMKSQCNGNLDEGREKQMTSVHNDMDHVLDRKDLQSSDQLKLYNQVLERYRSLTNPRRSEPNDKAESLGSI